MFRSKYRVAAAAVGVTVAGSLLPAMPAHAQSTYVGKVAANGLAVRHLPTTASAVEGNLSNGQQIEIICKVRGSSVNGNALWYSLPTLNEWVAARHVQDLAAVVRKLLGRTTTAITRAAPTTASARSARWPEGPVWTSSASWKANR